MSVCCRKRLFEDSPVSSTSTKRLRCASYVSPVGYSPWSPASPAPHDPSKDDSSASIDRTAWIELFVREMSSATSVDDAKSRAFRALESFEKFLQTHTASDVVVSQALRDENTVLKKQIQEKNLENSILRRDVNIQDDRLKEHESRNKEVVELKQLVTQQRELVTSLEVKNYALALHLQQALQSTPIANSFHPHVF